MTKINPITNILKPAIKEFATNKPYNFTKPPFAI